MELIFGKTAVNIMDSGQIMTCRAMVYIFMLTVLDTMANTLMIRRRATDCTTGLMVVSTKAGGTRASSMASALILTAPSNQ